LLLERADGWVSNVLVPQATLLERVVRARHERGRGFQLVLGLLTSIRPDLDDALRLARAELVAALRAPDVRSRLDWIGEAELGARLGSLCAERRYEEAAELLSDEIVRQFVVVCRPGELRDEVARYGDADVAVAIPVGGFLALPGLLATSPADALAARRAVAEELLGAAV
ncbi:MAG TPA: LLM class flavin-dependent oxidoreductase, partial [Acidimicrobiales bacterium]|nr:LLM class flavin-dependent oxidoreductase [Acidimicrobiales bacterium]